MFKRSPNKREVDDDLPPAASAVAEGQAPQDAAAALRQIMPDPYFINTPASQMPRHLDLLHRVEVENIIIDFHRMPHSQLTELLICAYDDIDPGLLSKVCGTLAAAHIDIQTAFVFTIDKARLKSASKVLGKAERSIVLDTLFITEPFHRRTRALSAATIQELNKRLMQVIRGEETVGHLLARAHQRPYPPILMHEIAAFNTASGDRTIIKMRTQNVAGVLYRTTAALASLGLDIHIAQINTEGDSTNDVFFVTKTDGSVLSEAELLRLPPKLRSILQNLTVAPGETGTL